MNYAEIVLPQMNAPQSVPGTLQTLAPLTIEIGGADSQHYKSIDSLTWADIPPFAVLTGLNGSGKTQLLQLLAFWITQTWLPQFAVGDPRGDPRRTRIVIKGDSFGPDDVAFLLSSDYLQGSANLNFAQMQQAKQQLYQTLTQQSYRQNLNLRAKRARIEKLLGINLDSVRSEDFPKLLPDDFVFMLEDTDVITGLGYVFLAYRLQYLQELEKQHRPDLQKQNPAKEVLATLGPAPWDVVNEALETAEFSYRVVSPLQSGLLDPYQLRLVDRFSGQLLDPADLSSGEKVILQLVLWLYNSKHHNRFPRLLLLDEPDAHLHPSMTRQFMDVIKEVLVERYKVRVILTTHSPSTVAMAPDNSVFVMSRTQPRIRPSVSKADTVGLLTAGFVIVSRGTRYVLVEDEADVEFYSAIRDILSDYGPSKDRRALRPSPSIVFLPASLGEGKNRVGGGKSVVTQWVEKFDASPLDQLFRGIIDRDAGNIATQRVNVIGRYSIENYLLDPFVVFGVLLDAGTAPLIAGVSISRGDEHQIRSMPEPELQAIASAILSMVEKKLLGLTNAEQTLRAVTFTNAKTVNYPAWMIDRRGRDLLQLYQAVFGGPSVISARRLEKSLRRVRLVPVELADIMNRLQD